MTKQDHSIKLFLITSSLFVSSDVLAVPDQPPPEAIEACSSASEGSSCSVQTPEGLLSGSCLSNEEQSESLLACVPDNGTPPPTEVTTDTSSTDQTTGNTGSENTANTNQAIYDTSTASLSLPVVSIGNDQYFKVSLQVVESTPIRLQLTEATQISSSTFSTTMVSATYDSSSEILSIPSLNLNGKSNRVELKRNTSLSGYQFELLSLEEFTSFNIVDTGQSACYSSAGSPVSCSNSGQDGAYSGNQPSYTNNGDGTIADNVTGLVWQSSPDTNGDGSIDSADKLSQSNALSYCSSLSYANQTDWRLPTIKQMYSLINFNGEDVSGVDSDDTSNLIPFIDTNYFAFAYGDTRVGDRIIDVQYATSTLYVSPAVITTMFGVNMADGRIKGYGTTINNSEKTFVVQCVRGQDDYGNNYFTDNGDQTISDAASSLMWEQNDSQTGMDWDAAISYCENSSSAGYFDWRLPNAKELQSIVDYTRSPDSSNSAAIDPLFNAISMTNEAGQNDWGYYWTGTTHIKSAGPGDSAVYISFGRAMGYNNGQWQDVHGAGAQRSNLKLSTEQLDPAYTIVTDANGNQAITHGPQGDVLRVNNFARCVR